MTNSISLCTDMSGLLFTTDSGTTCIPLSGPGAIVSLDDDDQLQAVQAGQELTGSGFVEPLADAQWTMSYNEETKISFIIGVTDMDVNLNGKFHNFLMTTQKVNIRNDGTNLTVISAPA
ncbi:MAG: hypothetical protein AAFW73_09495 [Bacteroidota bacterium]